MWYNIDMVKALITIMDYYPYPQPGGTKAIYVDESGKKYIGKPRDVVVGEHYTVEIHADDLDKPYIPIGKWLP